MQKKRRKQKHMNFSFLCGDGSHTVLVLPNRMTSICVSFGVYSVQHGTKTVQVLCVFLCFMDTFLRNKSSLSIATNEKCISWQCYKITPIGFEGKWTCFYFTNFVIDVTSSAEYLCPD